MKKLALCLVVLMFTGMVFSEAVGVTMFRHQEMDITFEDYPEIDDLDFMGSPFTIEKDPYEETPTFYIVGGSEPDDYRYLLRLTDPLGETPQLELLAEVPIYIGAHPDYEEGEIALFGQWVYLTGLAVSEDHIFIGGRTHLGGIEGGDGPDGVYIVRYTKDGEVDQVRINDVAAHQIRGLHYVEFEESVTYYVNDDDGSFAHEPGEGVSEYQASDALLATSGRAIYGINPQDIEFHPGAEGHFNLNYRPAFWSQTVRRTTRDLVYDHDTGDLFLIASGLSDGIAGEDMHGQWEQVYPEGWPSFDSPGIIRQENYHPLIRPADEPDAPRGQGTATEEIISLPIHEDAGDQNSAAWAGLDLYTSENDEKFLAAVDYWNRRFYIYNVQYEEGEFVHAYEVYMEERSDWQQPMNPVFFEDEEGAVYLLLLNSFRSNVEVYEMEIEPTFSSSWSLFN